MRTHLTLLLGAHDHPVLESYEDDEGEEQIMVKLDEFASVLGDAKDVRRWIEELSVKAALL